MNDLEKRAREIAELDKDDMTGVHRSTWQNQYADASDVVEGFVGVPRGTRKACDTIIRRTGRARLRVIRTDYYAKVNGNTPVRVVYEDDV